MEERNNLTRSEAAQRSSLVSDVQYEIDLDLTRPEEDTYGVVTTLRFNCSEPGAATFLDYLGAEVSEVNINGQAADLHAFDGARIHLRGLAERNVVRITSASRYDHTGVGLHRFRDPVDDRVYLYSDFEPFDAHRVYPSFDQPDLKGVFRFSVNAPRGWEVVSNSRPAGEPRAGGNDTARWTFAPTPPISTYITCVVAGPYHVVRDRHGRIELGLYARQSLSQYLEPEEFFEITKQGFTFFEEAFGYPYPFDKYDQIMVPEFNSGAMENAGCVTFNENYIFRSKVTEAARERRAETILHEMAHMWFGDLVTMKWWDDLWLNESFASYAAVLAAVRATRFTSAWTTFADQEKTWAYQQDQLPSTHPIVADMPDTQSIRNNFDGITYAKGASVLKQLVAWVGEDPFLEGLRSYFRRYEYSNTDLSGFLTEIEEASDRDLHAWSKEWLETAGVNTLRTRLELDGATIRSATVEQEAPAEHPILRAHRLGIGLYDLHDGKLARRHLIELDISGASTAAPQLSGVDVPDLVLLNDEDLAYAKIRLDDRSLTTVTEHMSKIDSSLARAVAWGACWDMVRDAEMPTRDYLRLVLANAEPESEVGVVQRLLRQAHLAVDQFGDPDRRDDSLRRLATTAREATSRAEPGGGHQLVWARAFMAAGQDQRQLDEIQALLSGATEIPGLEMDIELRWHALISLASAGAADDSAIEAEFQRDPTDAGRRYAATARAARPTAEAKAEAWRIVTEDDSISNATMWACMRGFQQPGQLDLMRPYASRYFEAVTTMAATRPLEVAMEFAGGMYPWTLVEDDTIRLTDQYLDSNQVLGPIRRILIEHRDGVLRAMRARARDRA